MPQQVDLIQLSKQPGMRILEIGFNAGHSAEIFLKNNPTATITSLDIGYHNYVLAAKEFIDLTYPGRHTLIIGDSRNSVLQYEGAKFDLIFIDGGHAYEIAQADLKNCFRLAHEDTIIAMDDTMMTKEWEVGHTIGPTRTWLEHIQENKFRRIENKNYITI